MTSEEMRSLFVEFLLDEIEKDPYPSREQMDIIEESIPAEMVPQYVETLIHKAGEDRFPSNDMLRRIERMVTGDC
jgi:hypothetical protein